MRKCCVYLLIINLLAGAVPTITLNAQEVQIETINETMVEVEMLDISDGLSQGMINAVVEDPRGYLWIATKDGLNRYDGSLFKVYRHDPNDSLSIAENYISHLHIDVKGRLWISTRTKGIDLYDPQTDGFIHFRHDPDNPETISSDITHRIFSNPKGEIFVWAADKPVLDVLLVPENDETDQEKRGFKTICEHYTFFSSESPCWFDEHYSTVGNSKDACGFTNDGTFWLFNGTDSIFGFTEDALSRSSTPIRLPAVNTYMEGRVSQLRCVVFDMDHEQLFVTDGRKSLWRYDQESDSLILHVQLPDKYEFSGPVFIDSKERIWVKASENQMYRVDPKRNLMQIIQLSGEWVEGDFAAPMIEDRFGNMWFPTGGYGLAKISARKEKFKKRDWVRVKDAREFTWPFRIESPRNHHFFSEDVFQKWVNCSNPSFLKWQLPYVQGLESHIVYDGQKRFWFVLTPGLNKNQSRLISFECEGRSYVTHISYIVDRPVESNTFTPVFYDRSGTLWATHHLDDGKALLHYFSPETGESGQYSFPTDAGPIHYRFLSDWWQDEEDCWWLATVRGLFRFNPQTEDWQHFSDNGVPEKSLSDNMTLSVCPDPGHPEDYIWVGTEGGGLNRLDRNTGKINHFTTENGLPNDVIYGILADHRGNLWLSTNLGLCLFDPQSFEVRNFTAADGLNGNEFNRYQYSKGADGTMYFGGVKGVTVFHPEDLYGDSLTAEMIINGLRILNKPVLQTGIRNGNHSGFILSSPIEQTEELIFNYDVGMITLTYSLLDFTVPEQHMFKYRMKGQDQDWIDAGHSREATYTNLSPGDYTFQVMGLNSHFVWSQPTELSITILPPWWATWWFRTFIALAIFGLLYALYRYRLAQVVQVERMRNRIAQDLHDEIGSTLSSISLYSAVIQKSANGMPEKSKAVLDKISTSTSEMMESMNDIVWTIKADNDHFEHVVNRMRAFAVNMTEARGISLDFKVEGDVEKLYLNMEARKNLYLIFKEAVNNSVKYANADTISVVISYQQYRLEMMISDNGRGFELASVTQRRDLTGGNGLRGMKSRAEEIKAQFEMESQPNRGTAIKVNFTVR